MKYYFKVTVGFMYHLLLQELFYTSNKTACSNYNTFQIGGSPGELSEEHVT